MNNKINGNQTSESAVGQQRLVIWLKRKLKYLFVRRLAIDASGFTSLDGHKLPDRYLFEWQKMPKFYRWF